MANDLIDIIVPVWNRPIETRACLVSLIENSSNTRLVLVDNSSDRETEQMLGEFAEALDVRVLFLKNRLNEGFVKAVNRGLSRVESRFVAIVRQNSIVRSGWLEVLHNFMNETSDAGIVVPGYYEKSRGDSVFVRGLEKSLADFAALLMRRSLLDAVGSFNEEMDGGFWCLKEYSRRAWKEGYRTCAVPEGVVEKSEELNFGSPARRAEHDQRISTTFRERWGEEHAFCIHLPKDSDIGSIQERFHLILTAARQGNRIMLLTHPAIASELVRVGLNRLHEHITILPFSRYMPERSARKAVSGFSVHGLPLTHVSWGDGGCYSGEAEPVMFSEFERLVIDNEQKYYERSILP